MKSILFFTPGLGVGGIEKVFVTYANALTTRNFKVGYAYCHEHGDMESLLSKDVEKYSLGNIRLLYVWFPLFRLLRKLMPDYLITGGDISNILAVMISALCPSTKCIISHHNYFNVETKSLIGEQLIRYFYNKAFKIISVSDGITNLLCNIGVDPNKIVTIYNPLNISEVVSKSVENVKVDLNGDYLVYVGRLSLVKNLTLLLDAFKILTKKNSSLRLLIVGCGVEEKKLKEYSVLLGLNDKICFYGSSSNPFPMMAKSKLVLLSSLSEALPTVILESFALGKTVVSTPTNGAIDLLNNGQYGFLTPDFTPQAFATEILKALNNPIEKEILLERASHFAIDCKLNQLCLLFQ